MCTKRIINFKSKKKNANIKEESFVCFAQNNHTSWATHATQTNTVVWTKNEDIVFLIKEFIIHDMYLIDISEQFPEQLKYFYGAGLKRLKDKVLGGTDFYKVH